MKSLLFVLFTISTFAQSLSLSLNPTSGAPGTATTLTVSFNDSVPTASIAGLQWTLTLPASLTAGNGGVLASNKVLTCNGALCLVAGTGATLNAAALSSGGVATIPLTVSTTPVLGPAAVSLTATLGANTTGMATTVTATSTTFTVLPSKYDLNGDGVINGADVTIALSQADGATACTNADVNADGKRNISDVLLVVSAALGVIH